MCSCVHSSNIPLGIVAARGQARECQQRGCPDNNREVYHSSQIQKGNNRL